MEQLKELKMGTKTAEKIWRERVEYYMSFYGKLKEQLDISKAIL